MKAIVEALRERHLIQDISDEAGINALVNTRFYVGFDPTAPYLHIGNLVPIIICLHLAKRGLKPIILFGGSTGLIGDPSGRSKERSLLGSSEIKGNIERQSLKVREIFNRQGVEVDFVNNLEWTQELSVLDFLRDTGKHFSINVMLAKEVIRSRIEGDGISFTEFSYMLLQAYDFWHLYNTQNCQLQLGGSDQWGNITAGLELIRKKNGHDHQAYALSAPLILDSEGRKFGKSVDGAIWIDEKGLSPYKLHQYLLNTSDADVERYLKIFTQIQLEELPTLMEQHSANPEKRLAQQHLADELVLLIHGDKALDGAKKSAQVLFGGSLQDLNLATLEDLFQDVPSSELNRDQVIGQSVVEVVCQAGIIKSKGEARRLIDQGGLYINNIRIESVEATVANDLPIEGRLLVIRLGKKRYTLVKII